MEFIHLHTASSYSIRYGASNPVDLVEAAVAAEQPVLALTDRAGLYGAVKFAQAAQAADLKVVLGLELPILGSENEIVSAKYGGAIRDLNPAQIVVLGRGRTGFTALNRLASANAELGGISPEVVSEIVALTGAELIVLLGPDSDFGRAALARRNQSALKHFQAWQSTQAEVVVELVSHRARDVASTRATVAGLEKHGLSYSSPMAARLWRFAKEHGLKAVITNAVRYARAEQAKTIDVLDATRRLVVLSGRSVDRSNAEGFLKTGLEMWQVLREIADFAGFAETEMRQVWQTTLELGHSCVLDLQKDLGLGSVYVPELDVILGKREISHSSAWNRPVAKFRSTEVIKREAAQADEILRSRCLAALEIPRMQAGFSQAELLQRLEAELAVIAQLGFASFFLTVGEVVDLTKRNGVRVAARGSGAGSLVNHLLGISALHPLAHGFVMERFLSPLRSSLPDIDIDVESHRRLEVYRIVFERFGADRVAAVSMMDTYRVRHAIRDVGKALAMPAGEIGVIAKAFPRIRARDIQKALVDLPELANSGLGKLHKQGRLSQFVELVEGLDRLPRNVAMHPCGVVLSDSALLDRTPIQPSGAEIPMSHFDKDDVEAMGFLKLDILGIRMQSAMAYAIDEIQRVESKAIELDELPLDDSKTFELVQSTKTLGCFQIESPGQRELVGKFAPSSFNDLIIDISLFRPGPVKSDMITPFLNARHGWKPARYIDQALKPILQETSGVVVFHEQVIKIVSAITGCSLAEADEVRRTLGDWDRHAEVRSWFYPAGIKKGFDLDVVDEVWAVLRAFASFGFCKAHAGAFALPTYQSAWLKAHHPAAFYAGILTHDPGMYPKRVILDDARQFQIPIAGIDVNHSGAAYQVETIEGKLGIRIPLSDLKGITDVEVTSIVQAAPFSGINDLWERSQISKPTLERLVLVGALDQLHGINPTQPRPGVPTRRDLLVHCADLDRLRSRKVDSAEFLFIDEVPVQPIFTGLPELSQSEILQAELEFLGLDISNHALTEYEDLLRTLNVVRANQLLSQRNQSEIFVVGVKVATQMPPVRSGKRVIFLTLDDSTGPLDIAFFEDTQGAFSSQLFNSWLLLVRGVIRRTGPRGVSLRGTGCWDLSEIRDVYESAALDLNGINPHLGISAVNEFIQATPNLLEPIKTGPKLWHTSPGSPG